MQDNPPSINMRGPPQPKSRTQGKSDHDSRPDSDQKTTGIQDDDHGNPIPIRQILGRQEAGNFDFGREFGIIKNQDEFKHRLEEYEAMNNEPQSCTDFPPDSKTQRDFALKIAKAMVNVDRASDATIKSTVAQRKPEEAQNEHNRDDEKPGGHEGSTAHSEQRKEKASEAVSHLNRLKTTEIEIMSWKVMIAAYNAQRGELCRGTWGRDDIRRRPERYKSWTERIEKIIEVLNRWKWVARGLFQRGQAHLELLVVSPRFLLTKRGAYQPYNDKKSEETAQKLPSAVLKTSSSGSTTTQNPPSTPRLPASADASPTTESEAKQRPELSTFNEFPPDSVGREFWATVLPTRSSSEDNQRPGQSSPAATSGLSAFTNSSPSARTPLRSPPRRQLLSSAPQRPQASSFPSSPGGASSQGGTAGASDTQSSANKRSRLSPEPQEDSSPVTRGAGASRSTKRQKGYPTRGGSDLNADDVQREEDDVYQDEEEE